MSDTIDVHLTLTRDEPNSMNFEDTYSGLADILVQVRDRREGERNPIRKHRWLRAPWKIFPEDGPYQKEGRISCPPHS